jgi:hypothetical protein
MVYEIWRAKQRLKYRGGEWKWNDGRQRPTAAQEEALAKRLKIIEKEVKEKMHGKQKIDINT